MSKSYTKLGRNALKRVEPGKTIREHGIEFTRHANRDGTWSVNVMVDGVRIHRKVGSESDGTTITQVEQYLAQVKTEARDDRLSLPKGRKLALSFADAADKYIAKLTEAGGKAIATKRQHLVQHLVPFFSATPLDKIAIFDIERYKKHRLSTVVQSGGDWRSGQRIPRETGRTTSPATINRELATLSHMFGQAQDWQWITAKPKFKRMKEGGGRIVYLNQREAEEFIEATKASENRHLYPFVLVALETSMRKMEVLSIRLANINLPQRMIYLPHAKGGARTQPMTARLADFLATYIKQSVPEGSEWLFPSAINQRTGKPNSKTGHIMSIEKPFRAAAIATGLDPTQVVRHTLRHTAISHLVQSGVDLPTVKRISGHKTLVMVERYAHQDGDHIMAAMDKFQLRMTAPRVA